MDRGKYLPINSQERIFNFYKGISGIETNAEGFNFVIVNLK